MNKVFCSHVASQVTYHSAASLIDRSEQHWQSAFLRILRFSAGRKLIRTLSYGVGKQCCRFWWTRDYRAIVYLYIKWIVFYTGDFPTRFWSFLLRFWSFSIVFLLSVACLVSVWIVCCWRATRSLSNLMFSTWFELMFLISIFSVCKVSRSSAQTLPALILLSFTGLKLSPHLLLCKLSIACVRIYLLFFEYHCEEFASTTTMLRCFKFA